MAAPGKKRGPKIALGSNFGFNGGGLNLGQGVGGYIGAFFGSKDGDLRVGRSSDGATFTGVGTFFDPYPDRGVRDPSIVTIDGVLWMAYTPNDGTIVGNSSFSLAKSVDGGATWTRVGAVDCSAAAGATGNSRVWAPEWFQDVDLSWHIFVSCSSDAGVNFTTWEVHPTVADMSTWSAPVQITSLAGPIDAFIYWDGTFYNALLATNVSISILRSASLLTGYTSYKTGDWAGWGRQEGPCLIRTPSGYRAYMDDAGFSGDGESYSDATAIAGPWSALQAVAFAEIAAVGDNYCTAPRLMRRDASLSNGTVSNGPTDMGPSGVRDGYTMSDTSDTQLGYVLWGRGITADTGAWMAAEHFKKTSGAASFPSIELSLNGGTLVNAGVILNTDAGIAISANYAPPGAGNFGVEDAGDYWRVWVKVTNNNTNTSALFYTFPASALPSTTGARTLTLTGSCVVAERSLIKSATITPFTPLQAGGQKIQHGTVIRQPKLAA